MICRCTSLSLYIHSCITCICIYMGAHRMYYTCKCMCIYIQPAACLEQKSFEPRLRARLCREAVYSIVRSVVRVASCTVVHPHSRGCAQWLCPVVVCSHAAHNRLAQCNLVVCYALHNARPEVKH